MIFIRELPKETIVQRRYTDWGPNHQLIESLYWRSVCWKCGELMFGFDEETLEIYCKKGHRKPAPNYLEAQKYSYEDYRELSLVRDGFEWLFSSDKHKKRAV